MDIMIWEISFHFFGFSPYIPIGYSSLLIFSINNLGAETPPRADFFLEKHGQKTPRTKSLKVIASQMSHEKIQTLGNIFSEIDTNQETSAVIKNVGSEKKIETHGILPPFKRTIPGRRGELFLKRLDFCLFPFMHRFFLQETKDFLPEVNWTLRQWRWRHGYRICDDTCVGPVTFLRVPRYSLKVLFSDRGLEYPKKGKEHHVAEVLPDGFDLNNIEIYEVIGVYNKRGSPRASWFDPMVLHLIKWEPAPATFFLKYRGGRIRNTKSLELPALRWSKYTAREGNGMFFGDYRITHDGFPWDDSGIFTHPWN